MFDLRANMKARYGEKCRKKWEELMLYLSTHYPSFYGHPQNFPPPLFATSF
jgi:hypothetical protein